MKLRHLLILGLLLFMNGFVCTVLFLMVSREMARPAPTPTEVATVEPTAQPTFTATSTPTEVSTPTDTPGPPATYTPVVVPHTPTSTNTAAPPTSTAPTGTQTSTATVTPTATSTPTPTQTATHTLSPYSKLYIEYLPNCGLTFVEGTVWEPDGVTQRSEVHVKVWTAGWEETRLTPTDAGKGDGYYDAILSAEGPRQGQWFVAVVDESGNPLSEVVPFDTNTVDCEPAGTGHQWVIVDFKANY